MDWIYAFSSLFWSIGFLILSIGLVKPMGTALTAVAAHVTTKKALAALKLVDDARKLLTSDDQ